jgi:hypothetical protein
MRGKYFERPITQPRLHSEKFQLYWNESFRVRQTFSEKNMV